MDWIHQDRFRNWLILVLLGLNLVMVSIIWMQTARKAEPPPKDQGARAPESVNLMRKALDLSKTQTATIDSIFGAGRAQSKGANDRLSDLKRQLAEEMFKAKPDSSFARRAANEIGDLQAKIELLRFQRFLEVVANCTPEQKEKLKPIVIEAFGRKPPKEEIADNKQSRIEPERGPRGGEAPPEPAREKPRREKPDRRVDDRPPPPSLEEKLAKYSERLNLTDDQIRKVRTVLEKSRQESEELRSRANPDPGETEAAKERIRRDEDDEIMNILESEQKAEFAKMISKRRN
jgi:Spy/CpxP family protein refolding chaperone